uniref:RNA-binding protein NOB1 n=1 Tax=Alona affinis TaxID=381656 RepID=A0A9N6WWH8_9CRUS|nr:EOG090X07WR [Alona affinis]
MKEKRVVKLVADSAAFIKNAQMQDIAEVVYTTRDVIDEIKCQATKQRLRVLPYEIKVIEPSPEAIVKVTEFSKKTGDYATLSATDIKVLALTYQLEVEANGPEHLKAEPQMKKSIVVGPRPPEANKVENIAGFHMPKKDDGIKDLAKQVENVAIQSEEGTDAARAEKQEDDDEEYSDVESGEEEEEEEDEDDDDEGWITPGNIEQVKKGMNGVLETVQLDVACITTDFAMQNVMMQMGLHVVSLEGRLIHEARTYILRCYACFRTTSNVTKVFCPKCGNRTLKKVAVSLNEDGTMQIHISSRKRLTARGKKFSLPMPKGGKYANNPILVEDQREAQQRATRLGRTRTNALDPDYIAGNSPFAVNDVYSRAAQLGRNGRSGNNYWNRRNPAEFRKKR